jgi:hypothetical protein
MDEHGRRTARWRGPARGVALALAVLAASGCLGPNAVRWTRLRYNEAYRGSNDEQLLVNIVRLRYADSPVFIDLPNITSQFELAASGNYLGGKGYEYPGHTDLGFGQMSARDTPTLSYHPREGKEIAKALLTPLSAEMLNVINAGANLEQFLLMAINDINDVPNAPQATVMVPRVADDNSLFRHGIALLAELRERDATEVAVGAQDDTEAASDPIPTQQVRGSDLVNAAKDGYVFRAGKSGAMALVKREKGLVLRIRPQYVNSPEMQEVARVFRVEPGHGLYRIKSELSQNALSGGPRTIEEEDVIYLNLRSILQIMVFLSKGVSVPEDHVIAGVAPMVPGPDGRPFDWTRITDGLFHVHVQKHRPRHAEVAVPYRGYWYYIPDDDVRSRSVLTILEILFAVEESERGPGGPLLTLPLGG